MLSSCLELRCRIRPDAVQLLLQSLHDAAVHLADAAFAEIERRADFLHRQLFVVVENDDQSFVAIQPFGDQSHQVVLLGCDRVGSSPFLSSRMSISRTSL